MNSGDTIVAPATPLGFSGLAVVRVSGPSAFKFAEIATHKKILKNRSATLVTFYNKKAKHQKNSCLSKSVYNKMLAAIHKLNYFLMRFF